MAWNEPGGNNQDPWGSGNNKGGGKNQGPPDLDEAFRKLQDKLNSMFGGQGGSSSGQSGNTGSSSGMFGGILVLALVAYFWNAVYTVDEKERAVILRFGEYVQTVEPGLHIYFPPIETKYQEKVTELRTYNLRQQMLTEDENIVEVSMSVQYNIGNVKDYVLNVAKPQMSLEQATQSALRHVVGSSEMYQVLTQGREVMGQEVRKRLQDYQSNYGTGLNIGKINIESAQPPKEVQASFDDVIRAREDEQRAKNKAEAYANKVIPEARGQAQRSIEEANAYHDEVIARAEGEAARFSKLLTEYKRAPEVTRERLYLETIEEVLGSTSKVLVDVEGGNNMMYLPLDRLGQGKSAMPARQAADLSSQEVTEISNRVAEELNKRVNSIRNSSGRIGR
ncbi:FtsH protease activity modulator HflK [Endozoicomonas sp. OPT23]|uniref:FtsH protease activity modulator HflK n=1 Tax=Endozoicomonas sp. OPT23 TaxID=2072845 RepID=UPI00129BDB5E|nr:FtsH protease activity modulator HflK [Endozoicomonas sp. OPT23]MRI31679.1 FtsH protease activity modulator HflK [Endozoicomonas sp. OPT23]